MNKKLKICLIVVIAFSLPFLLFIGGITLFISLLPKDILPFDDSHLIRPIENVLEEDNAFSFYSKAGESLALPKLIKKPSSNYKSKIKRILDGEKWDDVFVQNILNKNSATFQLTKEGNKQDRCIVPRIISFDTPLPYLTKWRRISELLELKLLNHIRKKESTKAISTLKTYLIFARKTQNDAGCLLNYLVSSLMYEKALCLARDLIRSGLLKDKQLVKLQDILIKDPPSTRGYILGLKSECEIWSNCIDSIYSGKQKISKLGGGDDSFIIDKLTKYFLHPNRTKYNMGLIYSELIDQANYNFTETKITDTEKFILDKKNAFEKCNTFEKFQTPNPIGSIVYAMLMPASIAIVKRKYKQIYPPSMLRRKYCTIGATIINFIKIKNK